MKKISKKLMAISLCLVLLVGVMPVTALAATTVDNGSCGDHLSWTLDSDGVLTISGEGVMDNYEEEYPGWYDHVDDITSIVIKDGVTSIGHFAFFLHSYVAEVTIPASVKNIGAYAFEYCESLTSVTIPEGVITISEGAFSGCTALTSVSIPESVTKIEPVAFLECYSLEQITVDADNETYTTDSSGVLFNKDKTAIVCSPADLTGEYNIPNTVVEIPAYAFTNSLYLEKLSIPESAVMIEVGAFFGCISLTEVTVDEDNPDFSVDERSVLFDKEKLALYCAPGGISDGYTVPDSVGVIYPFAFALCVNLTEVIIPDTVTDIGEGAFAVSGVTKVTIPDSVTAIDTGAFAGCVNLTEIKFEGDAPEIGESVLEEVTATVYYPEGNSTWTGSVRESFGGDITWVAYTPEEEGMLGDVDGNGEIANADLIMMARYIVDLYEAGSAEVVAVETFGDMDDDGSVTNSDLIALARTIVGLK